MSAIGKFLRPPARRVAAPLLRALDVRLAQTAERLEAHTVNLAHHHEAINEQIVNSYAEGLNTTRALVRVEGEAVGEYVLAMARIEERLIRAIEMHKVEALPRELSTVDWPVADYVNWVPAAGGLLAQRDLYINHAVDTRVEPGDALVAGVNERIVELPYAHAACASLPSSRVLDVGSCESILALELASLGHQVVALDPRRYPFAHPNLAAVQSTVAAWRGPDEPFDVITCVSAIEHFGVGAYGLAVDDGADKDAMGRFKEWLRPGGLLVLTVPFGQADRTDLQRVYDEAALAALIEGFEVEDRRTYRRIDSCTWAPLGGAESLVWSTESPGVAAMLLRAR